MAALVRYKLSMLGLARHTRQNPKPLPYNITIQYYDSPRVASLPSARLAIHTNPRFAFALPRLYSNSTVYYVPPASTRTQRRLEQLPFAEVESDATSRLKTYNQNQSHNKSSSRPRQFLFHHIHKTSHHTTPLDTTAYTNTTCRPLQDHHTCRQWHKWAVSPMSQ